MTLIVHPLVLPFAEIAAVDGEEALALVGGKGANLGELAQAGLPVPPGVCLTTEAYDRVTAGAGLDPVLDALDATAPTDTVRLAELAGSASALILAAPVPDEIAEAVRPYGDRPVAVRSSATAEDLPHASFAGQQDTYLNVLGEEAVLDAVRRCWASLWNDRAVAYRAAGGIGHRAVRLSVVIQEMVEAEIAGVLFTANPITGRRRQAVIDAAPGLGEAVVSGQVNPDHFVVDPEGTISERRIGDKLVAIRSLPGGGTRTDTLDADGEACLTDAQVRELAALGRTVEDHYGAPQDIEWAIDADGKAWLTQARPITTLYPTPEARPDVPADSLRVYVSVNVAQGVFRPFTPLGISAFKLISVGAAQGVFGIPIGDPRDGAPVLREGGDRLWFDATGPLRTRAGRTLAPRILDVMEARSSVVLRDLMTRPELTELQPSWKPFRHGLARVAIRNHIPPVIIRSVLNPDWGRRRAAEVHRELEASWTMPDTDDTRARLDHVQAVLTGVFPKILPRVAPVAGAGFIMLGLAYRLLGDRAEPGELATVLRALPHNVTTEMDLELWHLAGRIRADEASASLLLSTPAAELAARYAADRSGLPRVLAEGLTHFLAEYGDRAVAEIDLGVPRWSDDPSHILGMLANYLRLEDESLAPDALFARGAGEARATIDTLARRAGGLRGRVVRFALGRARELAGLRELPKFMIVRTLAAMRRELARAGAAMAERGELDAAEDVFFLTFAEVYEGGDRRDVVAERRETYERELRRRHIPRVLLSDGTEPEAAATRAEAPAGAIIGSPASPGEVTGVARVVLDPTGAHLEPGEILVAPSTDPGWTPLFLTAGGLVMEMGGSNSHGAVVAREYGIPAVVGVHAATERIHTGQSITVDGASGTVRILDEGA